MIEPTFERGPDSFWLKLPAGSETVAVRPHSTPFGETDEFLCYFEQVLIGKLSQADGTSTIEIDLLPVLDRSRTYDWPTIDSFVQALLRLLREIPEAALTCERDTDQEDVERLDDDGQLRDALDRVVQYCDGRSAECPTFKFVSR